MCASKSRSVDFLKTHSGFCMRGEAGLLLFNIAFNINLHTTFSCGRNRLDLYLYIYICVCVRVFVEIWIIYAKYTFTIYVFKPIDICQLGMWSHYIHIPAMGNALLWLVRNIYILLKDTHNIVIAILQTKPPVYFNALRHSVNNC